MVQVSDPGFVPLALSGIAIGAAVVSVIIDSLRSAALFLWLCGIAMGGIYLSFGAEYLAFVQWVLSTITALSFVFYSVLFGEERKPEKRWGWMTLSLLLCVAFILVSVVGVRDLPVVDRPDVSGAALSAIGRALISDDFLALNGLVVTLLIVIVGAGVLSRSEAED